MDMKTLRAQIMDNKSLKTTKEKAAAIYGAIAALAFTGRIEEARALAEECGGRWE